MQDDRSVMEKMFDNPPPKMGVPDAKDLARVTPAVSLARMRTWKTTSKSMWILLLRKGQTRPRSFPLAISLRTPG